MTNGEPSHGPTMASAMPLHVSLKPPMSEEDPTDSIRSNSRSEETNLKAPLTTVHRIREYKQRRRASLVGLMDDDEEEEKSSEPSGLSLSNHSLNMSNHSGNAVHRIRQYRQKRRESLGEQGLDAASSHSITWQRHASTRRLDMLSETNDMEENQLLSPASSRKKLGTRSNSGGSSRRLLNGSGTSTKKKLGTRSNSGGSSRRLLNGSGTSTRRLLKRDGSGVSSRRLSRDSRGRLTRDAVASASSTDEKISRSTSGHSLGRRSLSRTQQRRRQLKEQHGDHRVSADGFDNVPHGSNVKGTTLELLALIKKRREARGRDRGRRESRRSSLSPEPARKPKPRPRSKSYSPRSRSRKKVIPQLPDVSDIDDGQPKKWSYATHSTAKNHSSTTSFQNSTNSFSSFHAEDEDLPPASSIIDDLRYGYTDASDSSDSSDSDYDDDTHDSPKGVMDFPVAVSKKTSPEIDTVHQEKMKRMRAELEDLQAELDKMKEAKVQDMQELKNHFDTRKAEMMESAKKKIHAHSESEMELKLYAMDIEKTRLNKMQDVLERDREELKASIKEVEANIKELTEENNRLDEENQEIHRMYTHLSKWVMKTTSQNEKLQKAEEKLQKIYSGSIALVVEEKLSVVYRKFMYRVAQGVNCCNDFDFELNEEVWYMIKEAEQESNKEVIDVNDIDGWERSLKRKKKGNSKLASLRFSTGLDDHDNDDVSSSIRGASLDTIDYGSVDSIDACLRSTDTSIDASRRSADTSIDASGRSAGTSIDASRRSIEMSRRSISMSLRSIDESEYDSDFEQDIERLNDSVRFYENVLEEVSVNLDANQMETLHENKDMLISIFKFMDVDGSGDIDLEEFKVGIELLNKRLPKDSHFQDAEELFKMLDVDNSGTIDMEEFERVFGEGD